MRSMNPNNQQTAFLIDDTDFLNHGSGRFHTAFDPEPKVYSYEKQDPTLKTAAVTIYQAGKDVVKDVVKTAQQKQKIQRMKKPLFIAFSIALLAAITYGVKKIFFTKKRRTRRSF
jgi:hypothetical protein